MSDYQIQELELTHLVPGLWQGLQFWDLRSRASATERSKGLGDSRVRTAMAQLQQLCEAESSEPFKRRRSNDGLVVVTNRSFGDDSSNQDANGVSQDDEH